jgi:ADP-ribose pyrophosphatase YjhB (NUDIX family)
MSDELVTTSAAARELKVSARSLARWAERGDLRPVLRTPGGHLRWNLADLRRQLEQPQGTPDETAIPAARRPEPQPVVAAIVTSHLGVLAGRRNDGRPPWSFPVGEAEPGESIADAAVRKVKEECGLLVRPVAVEIPRRSGHPNTGRAMAYVQCTPMRGTDVSVGDEDELAEVRWLSLTEADELLPDMFEPVRAHLGRVLTR